MRNRYSKTIFLSVVLLASAMCSTVKASEQIVQEQTTLFKTEEVREQFMGCVQTLHNARTQTENALRALAYGKNLKDGATALLLLKNGGLSLRSIASCATIVGGSWWASNQIEKLRARYNKKYFTEIQEASTTLKDLVESEETFNEEPTHDDNELQKLQKAIKIVRASESTLSHIRGMQLGDVSLSGVSTVARDLFKKKTVEQNSDDDEVDPSTPSVFAKATSDESPSAQTQAVSAVAVELADTARTFLEEDETAQGIWGTITDLLTVQQPEKSDAEQEVQDNLRCVDSRLMAIFRQHVANRLQVTD